MSRARGADGPDGAERVQLFGIRHHSPTAAILLERLIRTTRPAAVLVEGPSDFDDQLDELDHDHELPIMIYAWAPDAAPPGPTSVTQETVRRRGAYYPLCRYSPEWVAMRTAAEVGARRSFIDLPWRAMIAFGPEADNRFADQADRGSQGGQADTFVATLARRLGTSGLTGVWDELIELPGATLDVDAYLERVELLAAGLRPDHDHGSGRDHGETDAREAFMADRIRQMLAETSGPVLVVLGAYHLAGVRAHLAARTPPPPLPPVPAEADARYGIALTPTSYAALDALDGYDAGQPSPGFYDALYGDRRDGRSATAEAMFAAIVARLRRTRGDQRRTAVSAADLISARTTSDALAAVRGHAEVWRTDLVEGIASAVITDDAERGHPLLDEVLVALRGDRVGQLAPQARRPPLVVEIVAALQAERLTPVPEAAVHRLDLGTEDGLRRSRLLHALTVLEVPAATLVQAARLGLVDAETGPSLLDGPSLLETWRGQWTSTYESQLVLAARFGQTLTSAVEARLLAGLADAGDDPAAATRALLDAALCGADALTAALQEGVAARLEQTSDVAALGRALALLMRLFRYDPVLRTTGRADLAELVRVAFGRTIRLLTTLPPPPGPVGDGVVAAIRTAVDVAERVGADLTLRLESLDGALARLASDAAGEPSVRGAAMGGRWLLGTAAEDALVAQLRLVTQPDALGDVLAGMLRVAREVALRRPRVLAALDEAIAGADQRTFLTMAPALRRAFVGYTPRERALIAATVVSLADTAAPTEGSQPALDLRAAPDLRTALDLRADAPSRLQVARFAQQVAELIDQLGLRTGADPGPDQVRDVG